MVDNAARAAVVERAARLSREKLAPRAADYDRAGVNPVESWRDLHAEGLLATTVPVSHGGLGLDMPTYVAVIRTLAQGCANTAMTVHMHSTVMRFIDALGTGAQKQRYFPEVVRGGKLFGSWGSEPAVSLSRTFLMETVVHDEPDAWVVDGVKYFCTMALGAAYYMVWCALDGGTDMTKSLLPVLVPADRRRHRHRQQVGHAGDAGHLQPDGPAHPGAGPARRRPGRSRSRAARGRGGGVLAGLCRHLRGHRRGLAGLRPRLRQEARRAAGEHPGRPRSHRPAPRRRAVRAPRGGPPRARPGRHPVGGGRPHRQGDARQQGQVPGHGGGIAGDVEGDPAGGRPRRLQGLSGRARLPRSAHLDAHAPHHGPDAGGHRQERRSGFEDGNV